MKVSVKNVQDVLGGLLLMLFGAAGISLTIHFPIGTAARMGPAYFPLMLGGLLIIFGVLLLGSGLRISKQPAARVEADMEGIGQIALRPLFFVLAGIIAFGVTIDRFGVIVAVSCVVTLSVFASSGYTLRSVLTLALFLITFVIVIFVFLLRLPLKIGPF